MRQSHEEEEKISNFCHAVWDAQKEYKLTDKNFINILSYMIACKIPTEYDEEDFREVARSMYEIFIETNYCKKGR
jgi:hypothetical protein